MRLTSEKSHPQSCCHVYEDLTEKKNLILELFSLLSQLFPLFSPVPKVSVSYVYAQLELNLNKRGKKKSFVRT